MAQQQTATATTATAKPFPMATTSLVATVILAFFAFGGYLLNWTWTGFTGNTLWDWLELLVLPLVLTGVTIWLSNGSSWRTEWTIATSVTVALLAVFAIGGYFFNWTWTGFSGNTLWDWLKLLLLPLVLAAATARFTQSQSQNQSNTSNNQS